MKVAIYLDSAEYAPFAEKTIASVRQHMNAEIWHLTTLGGPELSADKTIREDVQGPFSYKRNVLHSMMEGETLFLDGDVLVRADVSDVFQDEFDIAVTTDIAPGSPSILYNGGVTFSRCPAYWKELAEKTKNMDFRKTKGDWEPIEAAGTALIQSGRYRVKVLDGHDYNRVPNGPGDVEGKVIHYRGPRKQWMGLEPAKFSEKLNNDRETMISQFRENLNRDLPWFDGSKDGGGRDAIIVGGGPSLVDTLPKLRMRYNYGGTVYALNGVHDWLIERGLVPDYHVMLDSRQENVSFVQKPHKDVRYLISAFCHPDVFEALKGFDVTLWMSDMDGVQEIVAPIKDKPVCLIGGGATVGMKTMYLTYLRGHQKQHFFGFDSSYREDKNHAYSQPMNDKESRVEITAAGRTFTCAPWMAKQAMEWQQQAKKLIGLGVEIFVHGDGLIPWIAQHMSQQQLAA